MKINLGGISTLFTVPFASLTRLILDFKETNWSALAEAFPAMLALTFFGILHVPINVPALGVSIGEDNLDVDRELIAHGVSNALSGFCGSIQNYLVYTNSLLFIRSGGDSRVAGVLLAIATTGTLFAGTGIIGFIPIMVVGALIFLLGMELLIEALYDTWGRVNYLEYLTIMAIIFAMAAWDFVFGILVGIILSTFFFVVQASRKTAIRATFSGSVAKSTVRRHPFQQKFLKQVARQIYVCKLSGYMFFGTIGSVEKAIREFLEERNFEENPIRYLVMDFTLVPGLDYSAAETFIRMRRLLDAKAIHLILCGVKDGSEVARGLQSVGMWSDGTEEGVKNFEDLNAALEWCENDLLRVYYEKKALMTSHPRDQLGRSNSVRANLIDVPKASDRRTLYSIPDDFGSSPRRQIVHDAATTAIKEERHFEPVLSAPSSYQHFRQPMPLLIQIFHDLSDKNEDFWFKIAPFFAQETIPAGTVLWNQGVCEYFHKV
jgi:sulfate permease, SulP family